eukprot:jgi/Mesvir1/11603/Mv00013-RA.1
MRPKNFIFITVLLLACRCTVAGNTAWDATNEPLHENANDDIAGADVGRATPNEDFQSVSVVAQSRRRQLLTGPSIDTAPLVALKNGFSDPSAYFDGWNEINACSGLNTNFILCNDNRVVELKLKDGNMEGTIAAEIGSLNMLRILNLEGNDLSGFIPPELGSLTSLTTLVLDDNLLSGTIPPELGSLTSLVELSMYDSSDVEGTIPPELGSLTSLVNLDLESNYFISGTIPSELASLTSLRFFNLGYGASANTLGVTGTIPPWLASLRFLTEIWLNRNTLTGTIPPELGFLTSLTHLDLSDNKLSGTIPSSLKIKTKLDLRDNTWICGPTPPALDGVTRRDSENSCPACFDTSPRVPAVDWNCTETAPFCAFDLTCKVCEDTATGLNIDMGCAEDMPICDGDYCTACRDSESDTSTDLGCENQKDYLTGTRNTPFCYDWACPGCGAGGGGRPPSGLEVSNIKEHVCAVCSDSALGSASDAGCDATGNKFCLDWGPDSVDEPNVFNNDGDYGFGVMCLGCINDKSGTVADTGCSDLTKPFCLPIQPMFLPSYNGTNDAGFCVACIATPGDADVDIGCAPDVPFCVTELTYKTSDWFSFQGFNSFPLSATAGCYICEDTDNSTGVDRGCTAAEPYCVFGRDATQGGYGCSEFPNPACLFYNEDITSAPATCPTLLAVEAKISLSVQNCTTLTLDLGVLARAITATFSVPLCAVDVSLVLPPGRRLLQVSPSLMTFVVQVYVQNELDFPFVTDLFSSPRFEETVRAFFLQSGVVVSYGAVISTIRLASATSDPHFVTAQGGKFDFNGVAGQSYCILTDESLQVNARFVGADASVEAAVSKVPFDKPDTRTWMDQVAILHGGDRVLVEAASPQGAHYTAAVGLVHINGETLSGRAFMKKLPSGITIARKKTRVLITVPELAVLEVEVVRAAFWEAGSGPGRNFLNLQLKQFNGTGAAHGILGQHFAGTVVAGDFAGAASDYATSTVFSADCQFNRFKLAREDYVAWA